MKKRLISITLSLLLCLSLIPTAAMAESDSTMTNSGSSTYSGAGESGNDAGSSAGESGSGTGEDGDTPDAPNGTGEDGDTPDAPEGGTPSVTSEGVGGISGSVSYREYDASKKTWSENKCEGYTLVQNSDGNVTWDTGWYVVSGNVTINGKVQLNTSETVHLILCDGATLTVNGVDGSNNNTELNIYGQSAGTGELKVNGNAPSSYLSTAIVISGNLQVYGGEVTATAGQKNATETTANAIIGIDVGGTMTVYGGKVTGTGGAVNYTDITNTEYCGSTGIQAKSLSMYGGDVTATGGDVTATIGESFNHNVASYGLYVKEGISISGGTLTAASGAVSVTGEGAATATIRSCGIYQNSNSNGNGMAVSNGTVTAVGGTVTPEDKGKSYDIVCNGAMGISNESTKNVTNPMCTVQKTETGGAVKVLVGKSLTLGDESERAIQLAAGSKITSGITAVSKAQFNQLLGENCGYYKASSAEGDPTQINENEIKQDDNWDPYKISGEVLIQALPTNQHTVPYLDANGTRQNCVFYSELTSSQTSFSDGWYVVSENLTFDSTLTIASGDIHIILKDGVTLQLNKGLSSDASLHIYAQSESTNTNVGQMVVSGAASENKNSAISMTNSLEINSGKVIATGGAVTGGSSYGIHQTGGGLTVKGGELTATGGAAKYSYGIYKYQTSNILIQGGELIAEGGEATTNSYGIEIETTNVALSVSGKGQLTATGGAVTADKNDGSSGSYGINTKGALTVEGEGQLTATGGTATAGINGSGCSSCGIYTTASLTVKDEGRLTATGGTASGGVNTDSVGIYLYNSSSNKELTVTLSGEVTATGGAASGGSNWSAGINLYNSGNNSTLTVSLSGEVTATGGAASGGSTNWSAGICYNSSNENGALTVSSGKVTATSGAMTGETAEAYDIRMANGTMTLEGGTVQKTASGGAVKVKIGTADGTETGTLTVTGGTMKLARESYIQGGIVKNDNDFASLLASGCWYYQKSGEDSYTALSATAEGDQYKLTGDGGVYVLPGDDTHAGVKYLDWNDTNKTMQNAYCLSYTTLTESNTALSAGWYVVEDNVTISEKLTVSGEVHLILCDETTLNVQGIEISGGAKLTIYAQTTDEAKAGELITKADESSTAVHGISVGAYSNSGQLTVNGGVIEATGVVDGKGIRIEGGSSLTVNGGKVTATAGERPASNDNSGVEAKSSSVTVNGGTLCAKASKGAIVYGIIAKTLTVSGGKVEAEGSNNDNATLYGIYVTNTLTVTGGEVKATGGNTAGESAGGNSYGIYGEESSTVSISGGKVEATGGSAAGDGRSSGLNAQGTLTVSGGEVSAKSGSGSNSQGIFANGAMRVSGTAKVTATGGSAASGSFGIYAAAELSISNGTVSATSGEATNSSMGIYAANGLSISGGEVNATSGEATSGSFGICAVGNDMNVSGGTVQSVGGGAVKVKTPKTLSVTGGTITLAAGSELGKVSVEGGEKTLLSLVEAEHGYQYEDESFADAANATSLTQRVTVAPCQTHSTQYGTCDYCGKDLGEEPSSGYYMPWLGILTEKKPTAPEFVDVAAADWFYEAVRWAAESSITGGVDATHFGPEMHCTRAQLVTFLWRATGEPTASFAPRFADVDERAYYAEAVHWAASLGIVDGYGNGKFGPEDTITREQMATILYRFAKTRGFDVSVGADTNILSYSDALDISDYAFEAVQWAVGAGVMQGANGKLMPKEPCTRAQIVTMLHRLLAK